MRFLRLSLPHEAAITPSVLDLICFCSVEPNANVAAMGGRFEHGKKSRRLWRPLIGIVVAYAVAVQSLLIALGGFALAAPANDTLSAFELCLHDRGAAPALPAGAPTHAPCTHCIFCFARVNHAVIGSPLALIHRAHFGIVEISWTLGEHLPPRVADHSIASPRGPPPRA